MTLSGTGAHIIYPDLEVKNTDNTNRTLHPLLVHLVERFVPCFSKLWFVFLKENTLREIFPPFSSTKFVCLRVLVCFHVTAAREHYFKAGALSVSHSHLTY